MFWLLMPSLLWDRKKERRNSRGSGTASDPPLRTSVKSKQKSHGLRGSSSTSQRTGPEPPAVTLLPPSPFISQLLGAGRRAAEKQTISTKGGSTERLRTPDIQHVWLLPKEHKHTRCRGGEARKRSHTAREPDASSLLHK